MVYWILNGFLLGIIFTVGLQLFLVYKYVFMRLQSTTTSSSDDKPGFDSVATGKNLCDWPQEVVEYLNHLLATTAAEPSKTDGTPNSSTIAGNGLSNDYSTYNPTIVALNAWIHRYFIECRSSHIFHVRMKELLMSKLARWFNPESSGSLLVQSVAVADLTFGNRPPLFQRVCLHRPDSGNTVESIVSDIIIC